MPELPEVETVARGLRATVIGDAIESVQGSGLRLRQPVDLPALRKGLRGRSIARVDRYGKYLLLRTSGDTVLLAHLGMTGHFEVAAAGQPLAPHTHLRLGLHSGRELRFVDARRFGFLRIYDSDGVQRSPELRDLGPDPLGGGLTTDHLYQGLHATRRAVRDALLDQGLLAGVGNIYACEALYLSGIRPTTPGRRLTRARVEALHREILRTLEAAVRNRGTSFRDYVDPRGERGENQHALHVYGREGEPCRRCGSIIQRIALGGRSAFFCPKCQRP
jgi:formamidopyrimidine-DNA glycosylase